MKRSHLLALALGVTLAVTSVSALAQSSASSSSAGSADRCVAHCPDGYAYRTCTPAADLAVRRYLDEGTKLSREVTARYSN